MVANLHYHVNSVEKNQHPLLQTLPPPTNPAPQFLSNFNLQFKIVNLQFEIISVWNSVKDTALMSILVVFFVV